MVVRQTYSASRPVQCHLRTATKQLFVRRGSEHPWPHYGAVTLLGNPNPSLHTPVNVNVPNADVTLMSTNDLGVHGIPVSANGHGVDGNRTDQTQYHIDLLYL